VFRATEGLDFLSQDIAVAGAESLAPGSPYFASSLLDRTTVP